LTPANRGVVNLIVLAELVWALDQRFRLGRSDIVTTLERLLQSNDIEIESKDLVEQAVSSYRVQNVDLADFLISLVNAAHGCRTTVTLDRRASRSGIMTAL
jgi:predicted nucleic-acid-binding protein